MSDDATVVWLVEGEPRDDVARALREWARARGVSLSPPAEATSTLHGDPTIADRIEKELERAREAIQGTDADAAERSLARVDTLLREHPELPQAAWLRAEALRGWSARWLRVPPRDEARARAAWEGAAALDGGRAGGIGEPSFAAAPQPPGTRVKSTIVVEGASARTALYFDGARVEPTTKAGGVATYAVDVIPAEHQLLATADGRVIFASWIAIAGAEATPIRVSLSQGSACGQGQLAGVRREGERVLAPGVACPSWIAAIPGERRGSVLVARCEQDSCGPLLEWRAESATAIGPPQPVPRATTWPTWATWTLVAIGAATAASVAIVATGAFETRPVEPRFVVGGVRQE